jgi:hypothetical protein
MEKGWEASASRVRCKKDHGKEGRGHLATGPDEDDGRDASRRLGIPVSVFYELEMHICGIILVPDGPRDVVGRGQVGRVIDESLDDCDFRRI